MKTAKILALLGVLAMSTALIYGFTVGDFAGEGGRLLAMPWGIVSLVDVYTGLMLFSGWIFYREKSTVVAIAWTLGLIVLGFWTGSLYALLALQASGGDWHRFWLGKHAG